MLEITGLKQEVALPHDVDKLQVFSEYNVSRYRPYTFHYKWISPCDLLASDGLVCVRRSPNKQKIGGPVAPLERDSATYYM
eukprot:2396997-Pleurochrysis_carterae.AAC.1